MSLICICSVRRAAACLAAGCLHLSARRVAPLTLIAPIAARICAARTCTGSVDSPMRFVLPKLRYRDYSGKTGANSLDLRADPRRSLSGSDLAGGGVPPTLPGEGKAAAGAAAAAVPAAIGMAQLLSFAGENARVESRLSNWSAHGSAWWPPELGRRKGSSALPSPPCPHVPPSVPPSSPCSTEPTPRAAPRP